MSWHRRSPRGRRAAPRQLLRRRHPRRGAERRVHAGNGVEQPELALRRMKTLLALHGIED